MKPKDNIPMQPSPEVKENNITITNDDNEDNSRSNEDTDEEEEHEPGPSPPPTSDDESMNWGGMEIARGHDVSNNKKNARNRHSATIQEKRNNLQSKQMLFLCSHHQQLGSNMRCS